MLCDFGVAREAHSGRLISAGSACQPPTPGLLVFSAIEGEDDLAYVAQPIKFTSKRGRLSALSTGFRETERKRRVSKAGENFFTNALTIAAFYLRSATRLRPISITAIA